MSWEIYFRENGIRVTAGRISILNIIEASEKGLSAENIYDECKKKNNNLNLSTVYRTLDLLEEKDVIKKISIDGPSLYILKRENHKHILECDVCHKCVEIPCPMEEIEEAIKAKVGFSLTQHKLELNGICDQCKKEK
ncbi:MAG: Fur family transcriptional regulator [Clostridium sp.]|uniref:Fur family transcriptional regulator n=1 Tax=Clostridium sp. TaxID=1506 RepID=UPI00290FC1F0|nr:Fur family transcriptional regulator [Clostridium sp.]MDU5111333.1 Fur family transcriptional regulator [Clostridium sp.]